jgi:hypothetical protein
MPRFPHRYATLLIALVLSGLTSSASSARADRAGQAVNPGSTGDRARGLLSLPRPTGRQLVSVRSTFLYDPARPEADSGRPRAIPVRVWYPAKRGHGTTAPYFAPAVQANIEETLGVSGLFDIDTHATLGATPQDRVRGVLLATGGYGMPVAAYTGLITELASQGYAVVAFDHPHETAYVERPGADPLPGDLTDDEPAFQARLLDTRLVLQSLRTLVPMADRRTPIGIFGHSNGGGLAGEAMLVHRELRAGPILRSVPGAVAVLSDHGDTSAGDDPPEGPGPSFRHDPPRRDPHRFGSPAPRSMGGIVRGARPRPVRVGSA